MKNLFKWITGVVKKWRFNQKLRDMDRLADFLGWTSWDFPPSYYYRYSPEELEELKKELRKKIQVYFDEWDREEQEEQQKLEHQKEDYHDNKSGKDTLKDKI